MGYALSALSTFADNRRRRFDPKKKADLVELAYFRKNNKWKNGCPFFLEWPYTDIASMCLLKYTDRMLAAI